MPNAYPLISHKPLLLKQEAEVNGHVPLPDCPIQKERRSRQGSRGNTDESQWRPTFVLADLLDPGQGVHFHQRVRDADYMHHIHDALESMKRHTPKVNKEADLQREGNTFSLTVEEYVRAWQTKAASMRGFLGGI